MLAGVTPRATLQRLHRDWNHQARHAYSLLEACPGSDMLSGRVPDDGQAMSVLMQRQQTLAATTQPLQVSQETLTRRKGRNRCVSDDE